MKKIIISLLALVIIISSSTIAFADEFYESNHCVTSYGNPSTTPPLPLGCNNSGGNTSGGGINGGVGSTSIVSWAQQITSVLGVGVDGYHNVMNSDISNGTYTVQKRPGTEADRYWCTYLVIDSYNLTGIAGLSYNYAAVIDMIDFWQSTGGYSYLNYYIDNHQVVLLGVKPGYAFFLQGTPGQHTGNEHVEIVRDLSIDVNGNGVVNTYSSNTTLTEHAWQVSGWEIIPLWNVTPVGFGGHL